jgi:hypothetical protein
MERPVTVIVKVAATRPFERPSLAVATNVSVAAFDDGVPEIRPLRSSTSPRGSLPATTFHRSGDVPPVANRVAE